MKWRAKINGFTDDGSPVIGNIWRLYDTMGIPLDFVFDRLWKWGAWPDWAELYADMVVAGKKRTRAIAMLKEAVADTEYPPEIKEEILKRLEVLR